MAPPSSTVTVSADELERMMASVSPPVQSDREARRQETRLKSQQRTAKWPNTLEAMRQKKDRWKKDKEEREEEVRRKIDEEEARLQLEARTRQIERANALLYEQTDRMKTLRSKQLLADVVHHRGLQLEEKHMLTEQERMINRAHDQRVLDGVLQGEEEELRLKQRQQQALAALAKVQKYQLEEYKQRYIAELREEKRDGERTKAQAEADALEEQQSEEARRMRARQASEETRLANLRLRAFRDAQTEKEAEEDRKRDEDAAKKAIRDAKRDQIQREKRALAQTRKQRMIDLAVQNLVKLDHQQDVRLQVQSDEVRAKEDRELQIRADRRAVEKEATHHSRQYQLECKKAEREAERSRAHEAVVQWDQFGKRIEAQAKQEEQEARLVSLQLAVEQKQQADARRHSLAEQRERERQAQVEAENALAREGDRFKEVARAALREAEARGIENVIPIKKALLEKRVDLLPASGFRI